MPSPLELAPETIVIHGVLVVAVQLHNGPEAVTLTRTRHVRSGVRWKTDD